MSPTTKKPWPDDAVMIVGAPIADARFELGEPVQRAECRECCTVLLVNPATIAHAVANPHRHDRPILFFCTACASKHDPFSIAHLHDLRQ